MFLNLLENYLVSCFNECFKNECLKIAGIEMRADGVSAKALAENSKQPRKPGETLPTKDELEALANFRRALRRFLAFSEHAAADLGVTMQWYQALLVIKTYHDGAPINVGELAEELMIRDHSAAELVSRLATAKLVRRKTDPEDRRRSLLIITPNGDRCLAQLAAIHLARLRENKDAFMNLFKDVGE